MSAKVKNALLLSALLCSYMFLAAFPKEASASVSEGIEFCLRILLPAMFPYFVLSSFAVRSGSMDVLAARLAPFMKKLFRTGRSSALPFLLGLVSGYPVGAGTVSALAQNGKIGKPEANKLLTFCCGAGPAFVIGVVGGTLYSNTAIGIAAWGIQLLSAVLTGMLPIYKTESLSEHVPPFGCEPAGKAFVRAVAESAGTSAAIASYIILFFVLLNAQQLLLKKPAVSAAAAAFTELSAGCRALASLDMAWPLKFALTSACISFGGLCVLLQTASLLSDADLSLKPYLIGKSIQSGISFLLAYPLSYLFREMTDAGNFEIAVEGMSPYPQFPVPIIIIFLLFLQIPSSIWRKSAL